MIPRPSSLPLGEHCPGSPAHNAAHRTERDDLGAGTLAHAALAALCQGEQIPDLPEDLEHNVTAFWAWLASGGIPSITPNILRAGITEQPTSIFNSPGTPDWRGIDAEGWPTVIDWKYGEGVRWHPWWPQLRHYALAHATALLAPRVRIIRALVSEQDYDEVLLEGELLTMAMQDARALIQSIDANSDTRTPGPHCEHCLARKDCPEWFEQATAAAPLVAVPGALTVEQAGRYVAARARGGPLVDSAVKARLRAMDDEVRVLLDAGHKIYTPDGKEVVLGKAAERLVGTDIAIRELEQVVGREAAQGAVTVVPTKTTTNKGALEKVLKAAKLGREEKRKFWDALREAGALKAGSTRPIKRRKK